MPHALIVEDDTHARSALMELVAGEGFSVAGAGSLREARERVAERRPDVALLDLELPDGNGMDLFGDVKSRTTTEVILITGHASIESSVEALRLGAADYLIKPVNFKRLKSVLSRVARPADLKTAIGELRDELRRLGRFGRLQGTSPVMQRVYDQIERVAPTAATVFITGESGTGKELVSHTVHDLSRRHKQLFLPVNCGAVSPQLIESELFGHEKGSFTGALREHKGYFERASGGTVLLDEITEMPIELQVKLLRVLESGTFMRVGSTREIDVDVRVIAATNRNPEQAVAEGKLREDLLYRLRVFPLHLPALRDRGDDIPLLARHFLEELNSAEATSKVLAPETLKRLTDYDWPGNVRELGNVVRRAFIMADEIIDPGCLPPELGRTRRPVSGPSFEVRVGSKIADVERSLILATLEQCSGTKEEAAGMLGISLKTLYNRLREYDSTAKEEAEAAPAHPGAGSRS
ncbi:MAG TPA: sigma-54 dependent transcriptional regulator [Burkholderiales bacterium]|nr:sigma-54 dependent transcriptional regulator [Burkholderiales bacterium]